MRGTWVRLTGLLITAVLCLAGAAAASTPATAKPHTSNGHRGNPPRHSVPNKPSPAGRPVRVVAPQAVRTIDFHVLNAVSLPLTVKRDAPLRGHWRNDRSSSIRYLGADDFTLLSDGGYATAEVVYGIGSTGYTANIYGNNPLVGNNTVKCAIGNGTGKEVTDSPYRCQTPEEHPKGNDTNAYFVVQPKDAATHNVTTGGPISPRDVLAALCGQGTPHYSGCDVKKNDIIDIDDEVFTTQRVASNMLVNCSTRDATQSMRVDDKEGSTDSVGGKLSAQIGFPFTGRLFNAINVTLEVNYQHTWTREHTVSQTSTLTVAPGEYGWLTDSIRLQSVRANYTVVAGNQTFKLPNITVSSPVDPASRDYPVTNIVRGHTEQMADPKATCAGRTSEFTTAAPLAPQAGSTYSIALAHANQRVANAGANPHPDDVVTLAARSDGRGTDWNFVALPNHPGAFQLRSDGDPDLCLDAKGTGDAIVWGCKAADDAGLNNQLWTVGYDPASTSYEIRPTSGGLLAATSEARGAELTTAAPIDSTLGNWRFALSS